MAPLNDLAAVDVPGQVDEEIAGGDVLSKQRPQALRCDAVLDERHALLEPGEECRLVRLEVHDGDLLRRNLHVLEENGQRTSRYRTKPNKENAPIKGEHGRSASFPRIARDSPVPLDKQLFRCSP